MSRKLSQKWNYMFTYMCALTCQPSPSPSCHMCSHMGCLLCWGQETSLKEGECLPSQCFLVCVRRRACGVEGAISALHFSFANSTNRLLMRGRVWEWWGRGRDSYKIIREIPPGSTPGSEHNLLTPPLVLVSMFLVCRFLTLDYLRVFQE